MKLLPSITALACIAIMMFAIPYPNFTRHSITFMEGNTFVVIIEMAILAYSGASIVGELKREIMEGKDG